LFIALNVSRNVQLASIQRFCCPVCGTLTSEVVKGKELEVIALEIEQPGNAGILPASALM